MKYYIKTFGCQMNVSDSERIAGFLELHGLKLAQEINQSSVIIFNTCGVRQMAEDRVYGQIHNIRKQETANKEQKRKIYSRRMGEEGTPLFSGRSHLLTRI